VIDFQHNRNREKSDFNIWHFLTFYYWKSRILQTNQPFQPYIKNVLLDLVSDAYYKLTSFAKLIFEIAKVYIPTLLISFHSSSLRTNRLIFYVFLSYDIWFSFGDNKNILHFSRNRRERKFLLIFVFHSIFISFLFLSKWVVLC